MWKMLTSGWSLVIAAILLLTFSSRARKGAKQAIVKGAGATIELSNQFRGTGSKAGKQKAEDNEVRYPPYVGYETSKGLAEKTSKATPIRKVNPTRFKNAKNVMNDERMPHQMAEVAEEFDLF
ncbi:hypothetical protein [Bacillus sp. RAR_GA_16]|uniref:hypothetical protein n=1 Tax=Bacillus sp. RAR_GA_16 TaxID=2876774 RepID=UPI001CC9CE81|nr:hypothetical protein [Bacillus sp. RAR_GA_16]MCA0172181.1 hypothetical protein [Bacillus sp. RAR_GA_16]